MDYLLPKRSSGYDVSAAIAILVLYFIGLVMVAWSYIRILYTIRTNPGYVPLGPATEKQNLDNQDVEMEAGRGSPTSPPRQSVAGEPYSENGSDAPGAPESSLDAPGLEEFYTKDMFVCEADGRPRWCSTCQAWKPDRAHHNGSAADRCFKKEDHFCPWVGGMVCLTNFKFFVQFTTYATFHTAFVVGVMAYYVNQTRGRDMDPQWAVLLGVASFFCLFALGMSVTATHSTCVALTGVEQLGHLSRKYFLAVHVPKGENGMPKIGGSETEVGGVQTQSLVTVVYPGDRTFVVLQTQPGDRPWDLGSPLANWKEVMGNNVMDWLLPLKMSPCCNEDGRTFFRFGPAVDRLLERHGLPKRAAT